MTYVDKFLCKLKTGKTEREGKGRERERDKQEDIKEIINKGTAI